MPSASRLHDSNMIDSEKGSPVPHYVSVKIGALDAGAKRELTALKLIANARPSHEGLSFIRTPIDDFQIEGPKGTYFCLVYQPMRETLLSFRCRFSNQKLPLPIFKLFTYCLLQALDYLHTECHLIHTGKSTSFSPPFELPCRTQCRHFALDI